MEEIEMLLGARDQEEEYRNRAAEYLEYWMAHSINQNLDVAHAMFQYDVGDSYGKYSEARDRPVPCFTKEKCANGLV